MIKSTPMAIATTDLTRTFGELIAVNSVSLHIPRGELFGLLGTNGAGKTTLLKLLTGQLTPTGGSASVLGLDPIKRPLAVKERVGIAPELESPPSFLTPQEYLNYVGMIRHIPDITEKISFWLEFMDMEHVSDVMGKDLSKGMKQKVNLAAAMIHEPPLIFLDEPFIGLDPIHQKRIRKYIASYLKKGGTIFMCTHILEIAEKLCSQLAIISRGKIIAKGTISSLVNEGEYLEDAFHRYLSQVHR